MLISYCSLLFYFISFYFLNFLGYGLKFVLAALMTPGLYFLKSILSTNYGLQPLPVEDDKQ